MDFSKNTPPHYKKEPVELVEIIESALSLIKFDRLFDRINVISEFSAKPVVHCDRGKIKQVLINILQNAAHATEQSREPGIRIHVAQDDDFGLMKVIDNGCGIAPENLEKIWEPLFTTRENTGTGLGLDICKKIIEAHEGFIECESPIDEKSAVGSSFLAGLPLSK